MGYKTVDKNVINRHPEYVEQYNLNADLVNKGIITKYSINEEKKEIANAYILDKKNQGTIKVNAKNALLIGLEALAYQYNKSEKSFVYNPESRMQKLMNALMPKTEGAIIESQFYNRLFTKTCRRDDIRNCRTGAPYQACFSYSTKARFKMVDGQLGGDYTELDIECIADDLYNQVSEPYMKDKMTPAIRAVISETVDVRLQGEYGWAFSHQEYVNMKVNEPLIKNIIAAYPDNEKTLKRLGALLKVDASIDSTSTCKFLLTNPSTNPLIANKAWRKMLDRERRYGFDIISDELFNELKAAATKEMRDTIIEDSVRNFVVNTNSKRLEETSFIRKRVHNQDSHIDNEKDIEQIAWHLRINWQKIEEFDAETEYKYNEDTQNILMLMDMLNTVEGTIDDEFRNKILNKLNEYADYHEVIGRVA